MSTSTYCAFAQDQERNRGNFALAKESHRRCAERGGVCGCPCHMPGFSGIYPSDQEPRRTPAAVRARTRAKCHPDRENHGRGLCSDCYHIALRDGTLHRHSRAKFPVTEQPWFCTCRNGPIGDDPLGECKRCYRITAERAREAWEQLHARADSRV